MKPLLILLLISALGTSTGLLIARVPSEPPVVAQNPVSAWECRFCGYSATAYFQPKCPKCGIGMSRKF
ncbi:hypothetical protein [Verrucomicrobium sp. BvORR034]|uniref:hypothetical protein n=1 Tax=Verrucomicrobium sp. BvORR034 TaxID=1396418 RepID=UPI000679B8E4|nr:hypothetical protein [Verrucomicrobium sp. BvORR034]